jgi:superkiller protein 3
MYRIASIKQVIGMLMGAVEEYEMILKENPNYVPALKGAAESLLCEARNLLKQALSGRAVDCVSCALQYLARAVTVHPEYSCLWKLIGDCCMALQSVAEERTNGLVIPDVLQSKSSDQKEVSDKRRILQLSSRAYGHALRLAPNSSNIWHDLALSFIAQSKCVDGSGKKECLAKARDSMQKAVCLCSSSASIWNALGVVCSLSNIADVALAQHCFIKSLQLNSTNAMAWSNLGVLYLINDKKELAHEAFKNAQSANPDSVYAWIGQALIAESLGDIDAADLFRHSTELAIQPEGSKGFAYWVCTNIAAEIWSQDLGYEFAYLSDSSHRAMLQASDCLAKYTDCIQNDASAFTMYGLLLELQGLWSEAEEAHSRALSLVTQSGTRDPPNVSTARNNCARALSHIGRHVEGVALSTVSGLPSDFYDLCLLGLALFKLNRLNESYQVYEHCIEVTPSPAHRSCIFAALGVVAYALQQPTKSKALFFKSSQVVPPSPHGIIALCTLGLVTDDTTLAFAALRELAKLEESSFDSLSCDIVYMFTRVYLYQVHKLWSINV